jgi:hypothetical protein
VALSRSSSPREVERLIAQLGSERPVDREAAIARLRVLGGRALERLTLLVAAADGPPVARAAALRALEGSDDRRARSAALSVLTSADEEMATAAVGVLRTWIEDVDVLDALTAVVLEPERPPRLRLAALDVISQLPRSLVQPLLQQISIDGLRIPDDPIAAREWLDGHPRAPLSVLHDFIVFARDRERQDTSAVRRQDWLLTRGAAHALLARRGSRVALYDLREAFDAARAPLPLDFLAAIAALGEVDCLEPMARAWSAASSEHWWRDRLADTATEIMHRLRLSGRSAVVKRIRAKYHNFL